MSISPTTEIYWITLLPSLEVAASCASLHEAVAWMETYNWVMAGSGIRAVIDPIGPSLVAA